MIRPILITILIAACGDNIHPPAATTPDAGKPDAGAQNELPMPSDASVAMPDARPETCDRHGHDDDEDRDCDESLDEGLR